LAQQDDLELLERIEAHIGYRMRDASLALEAVTHRSFQNENPDVPGHNERLEFLGDAVIGFVVAEALMRLLPDSPEGRLTQVRAAVVNEASLAGVALELDLGALLRLGRGEEKNNGRGKPSILSDAVEAVAGAIFLDGGYDAAREVIGTWLARRLIESTAGASPFDAKTALQEQLQGRGASAPTYHVVGSSGPDHEKLFEVEIRVEGRPLGRGQGRSKKEAEKEAARAAMQAADEEAE
jgi:ribonuclease-3